MPKYHPLTDKLWDAASNEFLVKKDYEKIIREYLEEKVKEIEKLDPLLATAKWENSESVAYAVKKYILTCLEASLGLSKPQAVGEEKRESIWSQCSAFGCSKRVEKPRAWCKKHAESQSEPHDCGCECKKCRPDLWNPRKHELKLQKVDKDKVKIPEKLSWVGQPINDQYFLYTYVATTINKIIDYLNRGGK